ncbi:prepilin-type N-terminal cleavage/methylation domain-containing protein [Sporosarcina psychrophila]|uniref:Prepilin-type N-terminal cleavage/methylation domain-containing protein n=1 Tax=Sporosarcina psychrophila TaxID=1476 RepID=A0ABV2KD46_SPOPS
MWKLSRNNRGVTLVEVLAVLVLMSLILLMINGVHQYGQKQFVRQKEQIQNQENVQFAVKYITREIRRHGTFEVEGKHKLIIGNEKGDSSEDVYIYKNNAIYRNDTILIEGIGSFDLERKSQGVKLTIGSNGDPEVNGEVVETIIYSRGGDN